MKEAGSTHLCSQREIERGQVRLVQLPGKRPLALVRTHDDRYYAIHAVCPHQGAPLWKGQLTWLACSDSVGENRVSRRDEILRCPWHGFEYDLKSGRSIADPERFRTKTYQVFLRDGDIYLK